jgi:hypothetical protein
MPRWSSLKKRVEALFAPSVAGRVELRMTGYRWNRDREGRAWITVDGAEVHNFCTFTQWRDAANLADDLAALKSQPSLSDRHEAYREATSILQERGVLSQGQFAQALADYCDLPLEQALESPVMLHRALAVLDRRLGKRRLKVLELRTDEHVLVAKLLALRRESEGLRGDA